MIKQLRNPVLRLKIVTQSVQNYPKSIDNGCCHFGNKSLAELHNYASRLSEYPLPFTFTSVKIINYSSSSSLSVSKSDFHNFHSNTTKISHDFLPIWISITLERCLRTLIYIILRMYCQVDWPLIPLSTLKDSYLSDAFIGSRSNERSHVDINRSNAIVNMLVVLKL